MSDAPEPPADAEPLHATGYVAAEGFVDELCAELGDDVSVHERLVLAPGPPRPAAWALDVWYEPVRLRIASIGDAARRLRAWQRNWAQLPVACHRRAQLIRDKLPHVGARPLAFGQPAPTAPLGGWTLLAPDELIAAAHTRSPFPMGEPRFVEDRDGPPNRAYLKLWELFTRLGRAPAPGERCLDLGASPGGWTWVLAELGAQVLAVDKAPLDPRVAERPGVSSRQASAFGLSPAEVGPVDWLFSDVICYPERLLRLVDEWLASPSPPRMACTIKLQGATDHGVLAEFAARPGAQLVHLLANKHELTFVRLREGEDLALV